MYCESAGRVPPPVGTILMGQMLQQNLDRTCTYPFLEETMSEVGVQEVETYSARHHNTDAQFILTSPIMDLCLTVARCPGARLLKQWWEREGIYIEGIHEADWLVEAETDLGERVREEVKIETENKGKNYTVASNTIGTEPSVTLAYALGLDHHHLTMSTLRGNGSWLYRERLFPI